MNKPIIVTRHAATINFFKAYLKEKGYDDIEVITHATEEDVRGKDVYGVLPMSLACHANSITELDLSGIPQELRGAELSKEQIEQYGAGCNTYIVQKLTIL